MPSTPRDDGSDTFVRLVGRPFNVTVFQLAAAMHDPCPLRRCQERPWTECRRAIRLLTDTRLLLERAMDKPLVPGSGVVFGPEYVPYITGQLRYEEAR